MNAENEKKKKNKMHLLKFVYKTVVLSMRCRCVALLVPDNLSNTYKNTFTYIYAYMEFRWMHCKVKLLLLSLL